MKIQNMKVIGLFLILLTTLACSQNSRQSSSIEIKAIQNGQLNIKVEIEKWKQELMQAKQIGSPCYFRKTLDSLDYINWYKENPNQEDGLPFDDSEYKLVRQDFDSDKKDDLLIYFLAENCTGHNGGTKTFTKIIYSNGKVKSDLMDDIIRAIVREYDNKRISNNLKEITDSYLKTTTTISYGYGNYVFGDFRLYAKDDAHCCPSFEGRYSYNLKENRINIRLFQEILLK
ncbi:hypothetical protein [Snuella lapsa]|uniref:Uncharacterized protein n=1 Tax=Snuella lapsa TaxID=870481 RepID=A0ABP6YLV1_9FLAO